MHQGRLYCVFEFFLIPFFPLSNAQVAYNFILQKRYVIRAVPKSNHWVEPTTPIKLSAKPA